MLFPAYAYEFVRDLSHSILASVFSVVVALLYVKTFSSKDAKISFALPISLCLGMLSKYVSIFLLVSLILSNLLVKEGWKQWGKRRMPLSNILCAHCSLSLFMLIEADASPFLR